jgi:thiamine transport system permease protein
VLPRLARPLGFAAGLAAALSMGDLGVIALFAGEPRRRCRLSCSGLPGLPDARRRRAALVLVGLSFALFWAFDDGGRRAAA